MARLQSPGAAPVDANTEHEKMYAVRWGQELYSAALAQVGIDEPLPHGLTDEDLREQELAERFEERAASPDNLD